MRLMRDGVFVVHIFTTAVMCGLSTIALLISLQKEKPLFQWYALSWPFKSIEWSEALGLITLAGVFGACVMAGAFRRNKYLVLVSTTLVSAGHAWVAQTIWASYHFATGASTYPLIFLLSMWVFWMTSTEKYNDFPTSVLPHSG
jgi:hypothetical protein